MFVYLVGHAQYTSNNSFIRKEIVSYERTRNGFFVKNTNKMVDAVTGVVENYAYDKKAQNLYVVTATSNVVVTLTKDYAKIIKKNKSIPQLSGDELTREVEKRNALLNDKFERLNHERKQEIADSIAKAKEDSIKEVNRLNSIMAAKKRERQDYMDSHNWHKVPLGSTSMTCGICNEYINTKDVFYTFGIHNDSIYYATQKEGDLGLSYIETHESKIPATLHADNDFLYHCDIYKDSLSNDSIDYADLVRSLGYYQYSKYLKQLKKEAPFGYVDDWGWDNEYSMVTFNIRYTNMNTKTIRYLTVYFKITNDVGDIRKTGYFKGTGPLEEAESASWNWDSSSYFTAGDASKMEITKIVLTYMNGSQKVLTGDNIIYN